ncbi:MAG: porin [Phycisphaerales bacterium]
MTHRALSTVALVATTTLVGSVASAAESNVDDALLQEIQSLRARVAELERPADESAAARSAEIRAIVADALADADSRSSMLQSGGMAGHNGAFHIGSADGNFRLNVKGGMQIRYLYSMQDNSGGDDSVSGFENTRNRFGFSGHIVDPSWKYNIWGGWNASGGAVLLDAWVQKDLGNGWAIRAGQFKLPTWQEWSVSEMRQQFVERSVLDARFSQSYSQGVMAAYRQDNMRFYAAFSDGLRSLNTPFAGGTGVDPNGVDYALTARAEWLVSGDWSNYSDFQSFQGDESTTVIGGGIHHQRGESGTAANELEITEFNLDGSFEFGGANVFAAFVYRTYDDDASVDRDEMGFLIQGGYFLSDTTELIARYEYGDLDGAGGAAGDDLSLLTVGVNRYWAKHSLKWSTDLGYALDPVSSTWGSASRGFRGDAMNEDGQIVLRSQLQLTF